MIALIVHFFQEQSCPTPFASLPALGLTSGTAQTCTPHGVN
jgi:hypothetical protein